MKAVILAGGKGTRLAERAKGLPKPLVEVNGKALVDYQLELLARYGASEVVLLCGYGAEAVRAHCGDGSRWKLKLKYVNEAAPLGTAGAVVAAVDALPEEFLVLYGDTVLDVDLERFGRAHQESGAAGTLFLHPNDHPWDSDLVECNASGKILAIHGYPHPEGRNLPNQVNAALYFLQAGLLRGIAVPEKPLDFAKHLFPQLLKQGAHLHGYRSPEYIKDAGTPERLDTVERDLRSGLVARSSLAVKRPAVFLDRDGTMNEEVSYISRPEQLRLIAGAAEGIKRLRDAGYRVVVATNQPVVARGECSEDDLRRVHDHLEMELSRAGAFLDGIYWCPHHPHKGFAGERAELKRECACRKPATGMLEQAARELNLDLEASWLIGDSTGDLETAKNAGVRAVLVRTGLGGRDGKYASKAELVAGNLLEAAKSIVERTR